MTTGIVFAYQYTQEGTCARVNGARLEALLQVMKRPLESYTQAAMRDGKVEEFIPCLNVRVEFIRHHVAYL